MISLTYGILKKKQQMNKQKRNKLTGTENKLMVARGEGKGRWAKKVQENKRHKLPVVKEISPGHVMYSLVIIVNNTLLHY